MGSGREHCDSFERSSLIAAGGDCVIIEIDKIRSSGICGDGGAGEETE